MGNGRRGDELWVIAEHGRAAGYVRDLVQDPRVRVRLRMVRVLGADLLVVHIALELPGHAEAAATIAVVAA